MHRVERNMPPSRLLLKDAMWKKKLEYIPESDHEWDKFSKTKLKKETLKQLELMYQECCCYCESKITPSSYPEIEHFKPKSKVEYKYLCYDYNNLHYCCRKCNLQKSDEYSEKMFNPTDGDPEKHMYYEKYVAKAVDDRGQVMIDTVGLNSRKDLERIRIDYFKQFEDLYKVSVECISIIKDRDLTQQELNFIGVFLRRVYIESRHGHTFCSMIKHNFYEKAEMISKILDKKGYFKHEE